MISKLPKLCIVLPCYNEEEVLEITIPIIRDYILSLIKQNLIDEKSFACFIDDGSKDNTWQIIENNNNSTIKGIKLAGNSGHQNALLAGLFSNESFADIFITMDSDLQDDILAIERMIHSYNNGFDIVYGVRESREVDTLFKRKTAETFYDIQNILGIKIIKNHADFRLISKKVLVHLKKFEEVNLYLRAMFPIIGFKSDIVLYARKERLAGETKYPLKKMISFAWDGITSFSTFPLKIITFLGMFFSVISFLMVIYVLVIKVFTEYGIPGWASTVIPIYLMGGGTIAFFGNTRRVFRKNI